jgi:hypothetical protein
VKVQVFIGSMFEIGQNTGDRAGEFQHRYERYFSQSKPVAVKGAPNPVYCNDDGVCGSIPGMGKVASSASVQAIILNPQFDLSQVLQRRGWNTTGAWHYRRRQLGKPGLLTTISVTAGLPRRVKTLALVLSLKLRQPELFESF